MTCAWLRRWLPGVLTCLLGGAAAAAVPTFRIDSLYSSLDGAVQFIRLTETQGLDGQHRFAGLKITSAHDGVVREYTFTKDLPTTYTAHASILVVAVQGIGLLESWNGGPYCCWLPYYGDLPARFLATGAGAVDFAGVDRMEYARLPTDGSRALLRDGAIEPALLPLGTCATFPCRSGTPAAQPPVVAREFYHRALDRYFVTALAAEIEALESGRVVGWEWTGGGFQVIASSDLSLTTLPLRQQTVRPVCRFYLPPGTGSSHFLSASPEECAAIAVRYPQFVLESPAAFYATLPDPLTGECPTALDPGGDFFYQWLAVYRLWDARTGGGHRYVADRARRDVLVAAGWVSEGYGEPGVAFCTPSFDP